MCNPSNAAIVMRESTSNPAYTWRQYIVVDGARQVTIYMEPALLGGWRFTRVDARPDAWPENTLSGEQMVTYLVTWWDDGLTSRTDNLDEEFRARLLHIASTGQLDRPAA